MKPPPLHGINGRLRQHITRVGAHHANHILAAKRKQEIKDDMFLKELLDNGRLTLEQLRKITGEYKENPDWSIWLQEFENSILDRADDVFYARYNRDPTEDNDFIPNGEYYKICKNLERNWHYYNAELEKLRWDYPGKSTVVADSAPKIIEEVKYEKLKKGGGPEFWIGVAFLSLAGPYSMVFIAIGVKEQGAWPAAALGCVFIGMGLLLTFFGRPRCVRIEKRIRKCSECGHKLPSWESESSFSCSNCGIRFQGK